MLEYLIIKMSVLKKKMNILCNVYNENRKIKLLSLM